MATSRATRWFNLGWAGVQVVVVSALFFAGGIAGALISAGVLHVSVNGGVPIGLMVGFVVGLVLVQRSRRWVLHRQLRQLRAGGGHVSARVLSLGQSVTTSPRGGSTVRYTLRLQWADPQSGRHRTGHWHYRFLGNGCAAFERACDRTVELWYDPDRPGRYAVDIPYAPTMADLLLRHPDS